jgi:hypothetical protein
MERSNWHIPATGTKLAILLATLLGAGTQAAIADPYEDYVRGSEDFRRVKQDAAWALKAWPSWTYMPWTHRWTIGYDDPAGKWSVASGYNGAFIDHGQVSLPGLPTGRIDWINRHQLRFYVDHTAGKGLLHLWDGNSVKEHLDELHGTGVRPVPLNAATTEKLKKLIRERISAVKSSPNRAAYALDDEASWGHFVHPTMWRITDDAEAYPRWLQEVYGREHVPHRDHWMSYEELRPKLREWSIGEFDASPLMDQWSFNDSLWSNTLGELVEFSNSIDPATPVGIVGGQSPNAFGGYDYARLMRKVQFIESYNLGSSQAIIRSFNPQNALPAVTTHFHQSVEDTIWQTWYYLAHGNRGFIGWVDKWFDGRTPKPWHAQVAPAYLEAGTKIGPLMTGATWLHDGVAIYYSHASIQLGWILDAEAHGKTWVNRNGDDRLGSAHHVRHAWENMLRDSDLQYNFLSYVDVIQHGVPDEYKVLILPAVLCLSDVEAARIREFCERGGTVIADYLPGLWDQHGKGRTNGAVLDDLFGVKHDPAMRAKDVFGERLWVEVDQDANFSWKTCHDFLTRGNTCIRDASLFNKAVRSMPVVNVSAHGKGRTVLMNLSPQWYNAWRTSGFGPARKRSVFIDPIHNAGVTPTVKLAEAGEAEHGHEITRWKLTDGRTLLFICLNPEIHGTSQGGGNSIGLKTNSSRIQIQFVHEVRDLRNVRTGEAMGDGRTFTADWKQNEAVVISFHDP